MDAAPSASAAPLLLTARLRLVAADVSHAAALADFHDRNRAHLAPWDPPTEPEFFTEAVQAQRLTGAEHTGVQGICLHGRLDGSAHVRFSCALRRRCKCGKKRPVPCA